MAEFGFPTQEEVLALPADRRAELAALALSNIEPGVVPFDLFMQLNRHRPRGTVEVMPLRQNGFNTEILLSRRDSKDDLWPDLWHPAGVTILVTDPVEHFQDLTGSTRRIWQKELGGLIRPVGDEHFLEPRRSIGDGGHEMSFIYWAEVEIVPGAELPDQHRFFDVNNLDPPGKFFDVHRAQVSRAAAAFAIHRSGS